MCMFCAAIPAAAAVGARLNAAQIRKPEEKRLPVSKLTAALIGVLALGSAIYHTLRWQS